MIYNSLRATRSNTQLLFVQRHSCPAGLFDRCMNKETQKKRGHNPEQWREWRGCVTLWPRCKPWQHETRIINPGLHYPSAQNINPPLDLATGSAFMQAIPKHQSAGTRFIFCYNNLKNHHLNNALQDLSLAPVFIKVSTHKVILYLF